MNVKRLRALKSPFYGGAKTACRTDAKSNVTAKKQAYNSRSQVPVHRNIEASYD
jgi:hypothetical protein